LTNESPNNPAYIYSNLERLTLLFEFIVLTKCKTNEFFGKYSKSDEYKDNIFNLIFGLWSSNIQKYGSSIIKAMKILSVEKRVELYKNYSDDDLISFSDSEDYKDTLLPLFNLLPNKIYQEKLKMLLEKEIPPDVKEDLLGYQDITDNNVRKSLQKLTDSNFEAQRNKG
jgi:hypothetical protein